MARTSTEDKSFRKLKVILVTLQCNLSGTSKFILYLTKGMMDSKYKTSYFKRHCFGKKLLFFIA